MNGNRAIRVIKRNQRQDKASPTELPEQKSHTALESSRTVKTIVSGWVREWQQHSSDHQHTFASLFSESVVMSKALSDN